MRVLVADSDPRVLKALRMLLKCEPEVSIVGESTDASSLLAQAQKSRPDLVLLDWELPGDSITTLIGQLKKAQTDSKVVVLARRAEAREAALTVGADDFVSKTDPADSVLETLRGLLGPLEREGVAAAV